MRWISKRKKLLRVPVVQKFIFTIHDFNFLTEATEGNAIFAGCRIRSIKLTMFDLSLADVIPAA